jgi:hypothetical protein
MKESYFQILKSLIQIPSLSGIEGELAEHIVNNFSQNGWVAEQDDVHNILFCPEGDDKTEELPLLYAHLDTHPNGEVNSHFLSEDDIISLDENGQVQKKHIIQMGFDDKAGVAAILYLIQHTELRFRALLVAQEEISGLPKRFGRNGGGGIDYAIKSFNWVFGKSKYVLTLDRMNGNEIIDEYGSEIREDRPRKRMCSEEFAKLIIDSSEQTSRPMVISKSNNVADIYNIRSSFPNLDCINLSIGYYGEHKNCEHLKIDETLGVINVVKCFIEAN